MLSCGKGTLHVAGIALDVYGPLITLEALQLAPITSSEPEILPDEHCIDVLLFMHGREGSKAGIERVCTQLAIAGNGVAYETSLLVLAFDLPNHGTRSVDATRNLSWQQGNPQHGMDMWGCICRALSELRILLDLLPTALGRSVRRWAVGGISLGGHITAMALAEEPRFHMGMVVIGCGNLGRRFASQTEQHELSTEAMSAVLEQATRRDATLHADAVTSTVTADNVVRERWILVLHGTSDNMVTLKSNQPFIDALRERMHESPDTAHAQWLKDATSSLPPMSLTGATNTGATKQGCLRVNIYPGIGHSVPGPMQSAMLRWVTDWILSGRRDNERITVY